MTLTVETGLKVVMAVTVSSVMLVQTVMVEFTPVGRTEKLVETESGTDVDTVVVSLVVRATGTVVGFDEERVAESDDVTRSTEDVDFVSQDSLLTLDWWIVTMVVAYSVTNKVVSGPEFWLPTVLLEVKMPVAVTTTVTVGTGPQMASALVRDEEEVAEEPVLASLADVKVEVIVAVVVEVVVLCDEPEDVGWSEMVVYVVVDAPTVTMVVTEPVTVVVLVVRSGIDRIDKMVSEVAVAETLPVGAWDEVTAELELVWRVSGLSAYVRCLLLTLQ